MSKKWLITSLAFTAVAAIALRFAADSDTWWHLAAGRWMVNHGRILQHDVFSHSAQGQAWANPGWLSQVGMYALYRLAGLAGLNLITAGLALGGLALVWRVARGPVLLRAFVLVLAASAAAVFWSARPQMLTFFLTGVFVWVLERWRVEGRGPLWLLPVAGALWANLHGGFAVGPLLIALYVAGCWIDEISRWLAGHESEGAGEYLLRSWRRTRRLIGIGSLTTLAVAVNPSGPRLLLYPFETVSIEVLQRYIQEWQSPNFHEPQFLPFTVLLFATMAAFAISPRRKSAIELLLVFGFAYLALDAARNVSLFALVSLPALSRHGWAAVQPAARRISSGPELPERVTKPVNLILFCLALVAVALWARPKVQAPTIGADLELRFPVAAISYIQQERPPGPLLNSYNWGGYVIWRLQPEYRTYVDGRTDLFGDQLLQEYLQLWSLSDGWQEVLSARQFRLALLEPDAPLTSALQLQGWRMAFEGPQAVVLTAPE